MCSTPATPKRATAPTFIPCSSPWRVRRGFRRGLRLAFRCLPTRHSAEIAGYHCWADFFEPKNGWVPVDISEAWKHQEKRDYFFGAHDVNRVQFTHGTRSAFEPGAGWRAFELFRVSVCGSCGQRVSQCLAGVFVCRCGCGSGCGEVVSLVVAVRALVIPTARTVILSGVTVSRRETRSRSRRTSTLLGSSASPPIHAVELRWSRYRIAKAMAFAQLQPESCRASLGWAGGTPAPTRSLLVQSLSWVRFCGKTVCFGAGMGVLPMRSRQRISIQDCGVDGVGASEVHLRRYRRALALDGIGLVDQAVVTIAPVCRVRRVDRLHR